MRETETQSPFWEALCDPARRPFAVELDPPELADTADYMRKAAALRDAGADIITLADCPVARPRMDSSLLACKLQRLHGFCSGIWRLLPSRLKKKKTLLKV